MHAGLFCLVFVFSSKKNKKFLPGAFLGCRLFGVSLQIKSQGENEEFREIFKEKFKGIRKRPP
jgi:hypothetical protein